MLFTVAGVREVTVTETFWARVRLAPSPLAGQLGLASLMQTRGPTQSRRRLHRADCKGGIAMTDKKQDRKLEEKPVALARSKGQAFLRMKGVTSVGVGYREVPTFH